MEDDHREVMGMDEVCRDQTTALPNLVLPEGKVIQVSFWLKGLAALIVFSLGLAWLKPISKPEEEGVIVRVEDKGLEEFVDFDPFEPLPKLNKKRFGSLAGVSRSRFSRLERRLKSISDFNNL